MPKRFLSMFVLVFLVISGAAFGQPGSHECLVGPGLASTLLIPYFEVDLSDPNGATTLFAVNNGLASDVLTRVVFWTDWGVPTLAFDVYLLGFDVQTVNVRSVFEGNIPSTGDGVDLSDFDFCGAFPPDHANPVLDAGDRAQLVADHTGSPSPIDGLCTGEPTGDGLVRGYVTIDVVDECSGVEPFAPFFTPANSTWPYFADGGGSSGIGIISNQLWGDVVYVDFNQNAAQGSEAVGLWADADQFMGGDIFTFYGRYSGFDGRDDRVPLPNRWDQRFFNGGPFAGGANLVVWRDTEDATTAARTCGVDPPWYPLTADIVSLDENAGSLTILSDFGLPLATQKTSIDDFGIPYNFGWVQVSSGGQAWVQPTLTSGGRFSALFNGVAVEFLCDDAPPSVQGDDTGKSDDTIDAVPRISRSEKISRHR